jgi:hypothetical protein
LSFSQFDSSEFSRHCDPDDRPWYQSPENVLDALPDDRIRAFFVLSHFWRVLADQCEHSYLRNDPRIPASLNYLARGYRCQNIRKAEAGWLLDEAEENLSPNIVNILRESMPEAMQVFAEDLGKPHEKETFYKLAKSLRNDEHISAWRSSDNRLKRVAHTALLGQLDGILQIAAEERENRITDVLEAHEYLTKRLWRYRRRTPEWLRRLECNRPAEKLCATLRANLKNLFKDSCVYPGAGYDWSPLRQLVGFCHSFIFFDFDRRHDVVEPDGLDELWPMFPQRRPNPLLSVRFNFWDLFESQECLQELVRRIRPIMENYRQSLIGATPLEDYLDTSSGWECMWMLFELEPGHRVSLLYLRQEAVTGLGLLRLATGKSPRAMIEICQGGNCWSAYGRPIYKILLQEFEIEAPQILVVESDPDVFAECMPPYREVAEDIDHRRIMLLRNG